MIAPRYPRSRKRIRVGHIVVCPRSGEHELVIRVKPEVVTVLVLVTGQVRRFVTW